MDTFIFSGLNETLVLFIIYKVFGQMFETVFPFVSCLRDSTAFYKTDGQEVVTATP